LEKEKDNSSINKNLKLKHDNSKANFENFQNISNSQHSHINNSHKTDNILNAN